MVEDTSIDTRGLTEIEDQITCDTQTVYEKAARGFVPRYPFVLVRVLDRAQKVGLIHLPEKEQNKVVHEGIVIATWREHAHETGRSYLDEFAQAYTRVTIRRSQLAIGQHVLFPYWAGIPCTPLDAERYRLVKECDWDHAKDGGIMATVEYSHQDFTPAAILAEILGDDAEGRALAHKIEDRFLLVDRDRNSVTLSGR